MRYFPKPLAIEESDKMAERIQALMAEQDFGFWAVEISGVAEFIGFTGLHKPSFDAPFMPCVEVGWRLAHEYWGKGYATEAASAAVGYGFASLGLEKIVAFTAADNQRSRSVMARLGMVHSPSDDFEHPLFPSGHPLRQHVLYRMNRVAWAANNTWAT